MVGEEPRQVRLAAERALEVHEQRALLERQLADQPVDVPDPVVPACGVQLRVHRDDRRETGQALGALHGLNHPAQVVDRVAGNLPRAVLPVVRAVVDQRVRGARRPELIADQPQTLLRVGRADATVHSEGPTEVPCELRFERSQVAAPIARAVAHGDAVAHGHVDVAPIAADRKRHWKQHVPGQGDDDCERRARHEERRSPLG